MGKPIKRIELRSFRGATRSTTVELDPRKKLVVMLGENGTGKTTIVDALDALSNGRVGSLDDRSSANQREHTASINSEPGNVKVTVTLSDDTSTWTASFRAGKFNVTPSAPPPRVRVLRRGNLLELVAAEPYKRYEALSKFINVAKVEQSEEALKKTCSDADQQHSDAARRTFDAKEGLSKLWSSEGSSGTTALDWARKAIAVPPTDAQASLRLLDDVATELEASVKGVTELEDGRKAVNRAKEALDAAEQAVKSEEGGVNTSDLVDLLTRANKYLSPPNEASECPVCENDIDIGDLRASLRTRLDRYGQLTQVMGARTKAEKVAELHRSQLRSAEVRCIDACSRLLAACKVCADFKAMAHGVNWEAYDDLPNADVAISRRLGLAENLKSGIEPLREVLIVKRDGLHKTINQFNAIKTFVTQHDQCEAKAKDLEALSARLAKALAIVQEKRKAYAQKTLNDISADCTALYSAIHPGENVANIKLMLDQSEKKRRSILQSSDFEGYKDSPPQAYLSDSHLDTLGFCVWLAVAKKDDPANTILVMDDILSSADASHLTRIVQLLADECPHFCQVIVATHFRQWRDRYRLQSGPGISAQLLELHRWTLNKGVALTTTKLAIDELADTLITEPLPRQAVGSQAGIMLEGSLDRLAEIYELRLPFRRNGEYFLGELIDAAAKLFKVLQIARENNAGIGEPNSVLPQYDAVKALTFIRNQVGAHFNLSGTDTGNEDVIAFGNVALELARAITCLKCGQIPDRKEADHLRCSCRKCRMTPIVRP